MTERRRLARWAIAVLLGLSCDPAAAPRPDPFVDDPEIAALERAARWPEPDVGVYVTLATFYAATGRNRRGFDLFSELARTRPNDGIALAFVGVSQARVALEEPLLERVDFVEDAISKLDRAVELDEFLPRFLRAVTLAELPERFDVADVALAELDELLTEESSFIFSADLDASTRESLVRQGWQAIAAAAETAGDPERADRAWAIAGSRSLTPNDPLIGGNYAVDGEAGFRFGRPKVWTPRPGVFVAQGYDFGDIAAVQTEAGLVLIDAGTVPDNATRALDDIRALGVTGPVHTVMLTHAHWDHIGGLEGVLETGTQTIGQVRFADQLAIVNEAGLDYQWFFGDAAQRSEPYGPLYAVTPDRLVRRVTDVSIGGVDFRLHPVPGAETEDQLLIELPTEGIVFVGDAFMPYLGAPFVGEGSADGLLATIDTLLELQPELLIHGHPPLTEGWTIDVLAPLREALTLTYEHTIRGIIDGRELAEIVQDAPMPELLAEHPRAVIPFVVSRGQFMQRLHRSRTGYWEPGGDGLTLITEHQWADALDLLADQDPERWGEVVSGLVARGDLELAWRLAERGAKAHPEDPTLEALRVRALGGLRQKYQQVNPFKFIVFSEFADRPTQPLTCGSPRC